jgi:hypothetical protein
MRTSKLEKDKVLVFIKSLFYLIKLIIELDQ